MYEPEHFDISSYTFDEFITFLFARDIPPEVGKRDPWYWHAELTCDIGQACNYYVRLFRQPTFLLQRFSKPQLEQGFWAIQSTTLDCSVYRIISDMDLPFAAREECIRSMFDLFKSLFATEPLETSVNMWWDSLCYDWHCGNRKRERGGEDLLLQDVMFQTLVNILDLDSETCRAAALHGLGHLHHPETEKLVQRFIEERPLLTDGQRAYALAAAKFRVL
jgi:hypothetical protein